MTRENILDCEKGRIVYYPDFFADAYEELLDLNWQQDEITIFGKTHSLPRLNCWYADEGIEYSYSGIRNRPTPWTEQLLDMKDRIEKGTGQNFNSVLGNFYRDGMDYQGAHADDEKELGPEPLIASASFGAERKFRFKSKTDKTEKIELVLEGRSLLIMSGELQKHYKHELPKMKRVTSGRINLTFRMIK